MPMRTGRDFVIRFSESQHFGRDLAKAGDELAAVWKVRAGLSSIRRTSISLICLAPSIGTRRSPDDPNARAALGRFAKDHQD